MKTLLAEFLAKSIDWLFRVGTLGARLLKGGVALLVVVLGADYAVNFAFSYASIRVSAEGSSGSSLPAFIAYLALAVALIMIAAGAVLTWRDEQKERRKLLIIVEVRGLHNGPETPAKGAVMRSFKGQRLNILVDFRPQQLGELVNPVLVLERIRGMMLQLTGAKAGRDASDVAVAAGGLGAVPAMFLVGMRLEDEARVERYDWDRDTLAWRMVDGIDDGNRPRPVVLPDIATMQEEVVLAVSASYAVDEPAILATFPGLSIIRLAATNVQTNSFWSDAAQQAFAKEFRNLVQKLGQMNVKRIHMVLAAPASLALRLGANYDERNHSELVVYQYEKSSTPPYPWGILLPNHGTSEATFLQVSVPAI